MARTTPKMDVVLIGFGWTGAIMGQELTDAGLSVLAIERGSWRDTPTQFGLPFVQDEIHYYQRRREFLKPKMEAITFRHNENETALPLREYNAFLPGVGVGGAGVHWNGMTWRFLPSDFQTKTTYEQKYGALPEGMTSQDWGVTYEDLEPFYDRFERICGISGKAGNIKGQIQEGGNPFEGPRSRDYPNPQMKMTYAPTLFAETAKSLGYKPFPCPSANMSQAYTNPLGVTLAACTYCGFCEKYLCGNYSKSSPQTTILPALMRKSNFTLRTECEVTKVDLDSDGKHAKGVTYVNELGEEFFQPCDIVILCGYQLSNVRMMLLSGIGKPYDPKSGEGVVGRNYAYQMSTGVQVFFDDKIINPFVGSGALGMTIDEFNGDNFDHSGLGFVGGANIGVWTTNGRPIENHPAPAGTPKWGPKWKKAVVENYLKNLSFTIQGSVQSYRGNYLDLDPTYRDAHGRPLMRMTFDFQDNEHQMSSYCTDKAAEIAMAMNPREIAVQKKPKHFDTVPYQSTHNTGGTIMGSSPATSVVNRYLQSWDVSNVFVMGAGAFPQNAGYNPTGTVAALAYWSADAIKTQYLKNPGPLVQA